MSVASKIRIPVVSAALSVIAFFLAGAAPSGVAAQEPGAAGRVDIAIVHVDVVDVARGALLRDRTVTLRDGMIVRVERASAAPPAETVIDGSGLYLIPGLWDMHAHMRASGMPPWITTDWLMPLNIAHGVTGVRDMASSCDGEAGAACLEQMKEWQRAVDDGELMGPRLLALSSFPVNPGWDFDATAEQARGLVDMFAGQGLDFIKIYTRMSPTTFAHVMAEAERAGIAVAGHIPLRVTMIEAAEAGMRSIEHARDVLFDCFPGAAEFRATTRSQNPPMEVMRAMVDEHDPALCAAMFEAMVRNDTWYVPTHVTRRMDAYADDSAFRADPRTRFIPPYILESWNEDADEMVALDASPEGRRVMRGFYERGLEITGAAHRAGVRVLVGTDGGDTYAFPGSGVHDELGELVKAGLTPAEALRAATSSSAEFLGLSELHGGIDAGKRADLVLLGANPLVDIEAVREIRGVVFRGEYLDRARLDALLAQAEATAARPSE
ncbi:MAG TPA: amidohydrolase family protein [Longimicrobiales bacterium]|nr:amidohydrolase family protein [Longimicrobiales bacterium]